MTTRAHGIDISKYDQFFNPATATGQIDFVIQRASYRLTRDEAFTALLPGVLTIPIRGAYHYLNSDTDWKAQADKFLSYTAGIDYHFYPCDFEGAFNVLSLDFAYKAWQFIQYVQDKTGKPAPLYTSLSLYNAYIQPSKARYNINWDTVPLWQAQWWTVPNPDGTPTNPTGRTGGWRIWQYTNKGDGSLYGCLKRTEFDLDVYNGTPAQMRTWLNITTAPPPPVTNDIITPQYNGVERISGERGGWQFELFKSDTTKVRFESVYLSPLENVSSVARRKGAQIAVNGGEWDRISTLKDYTVSGGNVNVARKQAVPSLMILSDGSAKIDHRSIYANVQHALSGLRYLIQGGVIEAYLSGIEPQYTEGHARSIHGLTADGRHMVMQSRGVYPNMGLTLKQCAEVMKQYGAVTAFDSGGGGDMTLTVDGVSIIETENINPATGAHFERPLPQAFLIYAETGVQPMAGTAKSTTHELSIRPLHQAVNSSTIAKIPINTAVPVLEEWIAPATTAYNNAGDQWVKITYLTHTGWIGLKHLGVVYGVYTPPVATGGDPASIEITLAAGSPVVIKDGNGVIVWQGMAK